MREIKVVFKSGKEITLSLHTDESFESFWLKATENKKFFIAGDMMFNLDEVEYSATID